MDSIQRKICHVRLKDEDNTSGHNVTTYILEKCDNMPLTSNKDLSNLLATFYIRNLNSLHKFYNLPYIPLL